MLIDDKEFLTLGSRDFVPCECHACKKPFLIKKNLAQRVIKGTKQAKYCSRGCSALGQSVSGSTEIICEYCGKKFYKINSAKKLNHQFCSVGCSSKFIGESKKKAHTKHCLFCNEDVSNKKYCNRKCFRMAKTAAYLARWKSGLEKGYSGLTCSIAPTIRNYLFLKYDNKCCKCGWGSIHPSTNRIPLQVNHINGDAGNCNETNLELLCPNCHALTENFGRLNKKSSRIR